MGKFVIKKMKNGEFTFSLKATNGQEILAAGEGFTTLASFDPPAGFIKGKTGAGDAFCAGALVGIYEGLSDAEILDLGSAAAIASLSAPDAVSGMRSKKEVIALCEGMGRTKI